MIVTALLFCLSLSFFVLFWVECLAPGSKGERKAGEEKGKAGKGCGL